MDSQPFDDQVLCGEAAPQLSLEAELFASALDDGLATQGTVEQRRDRLLGLADKFYQHAMSKLQQLNSHAAGILSNTTRHVREVEHEITSSVDEEIRKWELEAQTWDLLRHILPLKYPGDTGRSAGQENANTDPYETRGLWDRFISESGVAAERRAVLEWLHHTAKRGPNVDKLVQDLQRNAERGDIISHGWIHTRAALKLHKEFTGSSSPLSPPGDVSQSLTTSAKTPLVTHLDPDAILRQGRHLQPQDEYFERAAWVGCLHLLRRGCSFDSLRDWCAERTEAWRSVSLSAFSITANGPQSAVTLEPSSLALWRRMCFALARYGGTDEVERAVYGILCGDIQSVEKTCKTWDDFMFMHYNSLLRSAFDEYVLRQCSPDVSSSILQSFAVFDMVQDHGDGDPATAAKRLVKSLSNHPQTREEASEPLKVLQSAIICNELQQFFYDLGLALSRDTMVSSNENEPGRFMDSRDHNTLRVAVHVLILFSALDELHPCSSQPPTLSPEYHTRREQEKVIGEYVCILRLARLGELIPLYCSKLQVPHAYEVLSRNLRQVTNRDSRLKHIVLIQQSGLSVLEFVKVQCQLAFRHSETSLASSFIHGPFRIMQDGPMSLKYGRFIKTDFFGDDPDAVDSHDENLICALEWMLLVDEAWPYIFSVGVQAYKRFLGAMHLNAARLLAHRVPIRQILQQRVGVGLHNEPNVSWIPEEDVDFWATQLKSANNRDLSPSQVSTQARLFRDLEYLVRTLDTMETIAALMVLSREDLSTRRDFWTQVGKEVMKAKEFVHPILNGWLLAEGENSDSKAFREKYLPETVLAYISTLNFAGTCLSKDHLLESLDVAAVIAREGSDVADCFVNAGRIHDLIEAFASCSKALADVSGETKGIGSTNKRICELGWYPDVWSVNS